MGLFGFKKKETKEPEKKEFRTYDVSGDGFILTAEEQQLLMQALAKAGSQNGFDASNLEKALRNGKTLPLKTLNFVELAMTATMFQAKADQEEELPGLEALINKFEENKLRHRE